MSDYWSEKQEWLDSLKAGDEVVVHSRWESELQTVVRTTPTKIVLQYQEFNRKGGKLRGGDSWNTTHIVKPTPELRDKIQKSRLAELLRTTKWAEFSLEHLERVYDAVINKDAE